MNTIQDFISSIENGELTLQKNNFFRTTKELVERFRWNCGLYKEGLDSKITLEYADNELWYFTKIDIPTRDLEGHPSPLRIHCFVCDHDITFKVQNGIIKPFYRDYSQGELNALGWHKGVDIYDIPDSAYEPTKNIIEVPSGKLTFVNFFVSDETELPEGKKYTQEYSLNADMGRANIAKYMASQGFGYGQMGNMGVSLYSNGKSIVITKSYLEDNISDWKYILEHTDETDEYDVSDREEAKVEIEDTKQLLKYFKDNGFKKKGDVDCEVWRWECCDSKKAKAIIKEQPDRYTYNKPLNIPVESKRVQITHYYHTKSEGTCPISPLVYSFIECV